MTVAYNSFDYMQFVKSTSPVVGQTTAAPYLVVYGVTVPIPVEQVMVEDDSEWSSVILEASSQVRVLEESVRARIAAGEAEPLKIEAL
jgi:hypothetical protein